MWWYLPFSPLEGPGGSQSIKYCRGIFSQSKVTSGKKQDEEALGHLLTTKEFIGLEQAALPAFPTCSRRGKAEAVVPKPFSSPLFIICIFHKANPGPLVKLLLNSHREMRRKRSLVSSLRPLSRLFFFLEPCNEIPQGLCERALAQDSHFRCEYGDVFH